MDRSSQRVEDYREKEEQLADWPVKIVSYRLGNIFHVSIHNREPGAWIARAEALTLAQAEEKARRQASGLLSKTKRNVQSA